MGKGTHSPTPPPQRCAQSARDKRICLSLESDTSPGRSTESAQERAVGAGPGCGEPARSSARPPPSLPAGAGAAPAGWRGSSAPPLCQGVVCLERLMCYFYSISTRCTAGKKGSALHERREIPGERNSSAHHPRSSGLPEFAGRGRRSCGCSAPLFLRETQFYSLAGLVLRAISRLEQSSPRPANQRSLWEQPPALRNGPRVGLTLGSPEGAQARTLVPGGLRPSQRGDVAPSCGAFFPSRLGKAPPAEKETDG